MEEKELYPETQGDFGIAVEAPAYQEEVVAEAQQDQQEPVSAQQQVQPENDDRERNLARLRHAREQAEYERDQALQYIEQMRAQQQQSRQPEPEDSINWESDEFVEAKAVNRKLQQMEQRLKSYENLTAYQVTEARIKTQFQDFDRVVNRESIEALRASYPEVAESLHQTPDIYNKAVSTYNIIKKFGLANTERNLIDKAVVARNAAKPKSSNSVAPQAGDSPLNKANDFSNGFLTEERKAQLWAEVKAARAAS